MQHSVIVFPLPGQDRQLKWWLTMFFPDHLNIFYMYAAIGNDECTAMLPKFQDLPNPAVFVTTRKVGWAGFNLTAARHAVITQKFWVWEEQWQTSAGVV
jgi:SNF2 family DNA or RNA helicase